MTGQSFCATKRAVFRTAMAELKFMAAVAAMMHCFCVAGQADESAGRPNVVLIMADDLGIEGLGCYGGLDYDTPRLDRLAARGLRFTHAYSQPLCTPTRVQLMTGKYNHRNWLCFGVLPKGEKTFGHLLSDLGYATLLAGKWQLTSYDPPDFPNAERRRGRGTHPRDAGFDEYMLFHAEETEDKGSRYANPTFLRNGELHEDVEGKYGEDLTVDYILNFTARDRDRPFFVYYPMALPHWPMVPTPHSDVWKDASRRLEADPRYFPDMVEYMDHLVGRLVDGLAEQDHADDTVLLFYSDNGTDRRITSRFRHDGRVVDVQGGKGQPTQNGIRVPLIAYAPGRIKPGICDDLVDASDFLPTLVELAGGTVPESWGADGVSFAPQLLGRTGTRRDSVFFWYDPRPGWDKMQFDRHIFALDHRYKLYADGRLFDIRGEGFREAKIERAAETPEAAAARRRLQDKIDRMMQPPLSAAAHVEVDAYGNRLNAE